ncbi:MAG: D-alanine aminotransferase [Betaproteobacteria bacterium ADurb.Bin341]|nr:MAG: D-alanine aminotransferase [Betaproteobacteria bacterium ADurb.Bin341]
MIGETVYLNGRFLPLPEARISPLDRGFLFGDGVYEVIPVYSRHPFRAEQHLERFALSMAGIRLQNPHLRDGWLEILRRLIDAAPWQDQGVYLQVTRGVDNKRDHPFPAEVVPTVFGMTMPLITPSAEALARGVSAMTATDTRWARCDLKTTALLANVLLRQEGADAGHAETILLREGYLTEGTVSSVLIVQQGTLVAPPASQFILPGVTCEVVLELARRNGLATSIRPIAEGALREAEEIWITSSTKEVLAVTELDGRLVGKGEPGPLCRQMQDWYQKYKNTVMRHGAE